MANQRQSEPVFTSMSPASPLPSSISTLPSANPSAPVLQQSFSSAQSESTDIRVFPVPCSTWIPVKRFECGSSGDEVYVAKLLHTSLTNVRCKGRRNGSPLQPHLSSHLTESPLVKNSQSDLSPICNEFFSSEEARA